MDEAAVTQYLTGALGGVDVVVANDDSYFFYDPGEGLPADHRFPFATLVTGDRHDTFSNLDRPGVFRLNIGVGKETFRSLFGAPPAGAAEEGDANAGHDFTVFDRIMPHPVYGRMYWICILNTSAVAFETLKPLLAEAYALAAKRYVKPKPAEGSAS